MGSAPCNLFCCTKPSISLPKSDIFVPQINIDIIQNTKNIETNVITNIIDRTSRSKLKPNRQTTEQFLLENRKIRNSLTIDGDGRNKKIKIAMTYGSIKEKTKKNSDKNNTRYNLNISRKEDNDNIDDTLNINNIINKSNTKIITQKEQDNYSKFREEIQEESKYDISEHSLTKNEEINITNIFLFHHLFNITDKDKLISSLKQLKQINIEKNSIIFKEGDIGSCIFFIISGTVQIFSKNSKDKILLNKGSVFGQLALLKSNIKRTYTAIAYTNLSIYTFDKSFLEKIKSDFIQRNPINFELFNFLNEEQKENLELLITSINFKRDEIIKNLSGFFWIKKYLNDKGENVEKDFFTSVILSENKLNINSNNSNIEIIAKEDTICHMVPTMAFIEIFGLDYKLNLLMPFFKRTILENKNFKNIFSFILS